MNFSFRTESAPTNATSAPNCPASIRLSFAPTMCTLVWIPVVMQAKNNLTKRKDLETTQTFERSSFSFAERLMLCHLKYRPCEQTMNSCTFNWPGMRNSFLDVPVTRPRFGPLRLVVTCKQGDKYATYQFGTVHLTWSMGTPS
ncbi:hypothetical protein ISCGN_009020 [Ixodes scapularis]